LPSVAASTANPFSFRPWAEDFDELPIVFDDQDSHVAPLPRVMRPILTSLGRLWKCPEAHGFR
jgi:hypothetical protein